MTARWTDEETDEAREMLKRGAHDSEFRSRFGRPKQSAEYRIRYLDDPKLKAWLEQRAETFRSPWTQEKDTAALTLKAKGASLAEIARTVGKSPEATKFRLRQLSLSPEQREAESRARHSGRTHVSIGARERVMPSSVIPIEVIEDRNRRLMAPQPAFGDPRIGYSALDRKQSAGASV